MSLMVCALGLLGLHVPCFLHGSHLRSGSCAFVSHIFPHWSIQCGKNSLETDLLRQIPMDMLKRNCIQIHVCCRRCMCVCAAHCKISAQTVEVHFKAAFVANMLLIIEFEGLEMDLRFR